ncbi:MAG: hypothetical protein H7196_03635 [candidate division SR1 bacterium]|nr:hypothetical protein [candidate division SR1 bacterium]
MMQTNKFFRLSLSVLAVCGIVSGLAVNTTLNTHAAGVTVTVAPSAVAVSTATTPTLAITTTATIAIGGTVQVTYPTAGYTGAGAIAVSTGVVGTTTITTSGTETILTATVTTAIPTGALTITISGLTTTSTATNNSFKVYAGVDYGANFQYVGSANVVSVRARVPLQLAFAIRNTADTANTNICDMGDLTTSAIGFCDYRLKVTTNARSGYTINVNTTGNFTNGTDNFANAAVGTAGTAQVAGTELYGAKITPGSVTGSGGTVTNATVYSGTNNVSYVNTTAATLLTATKPNSPAATDLTNTTLIRHEAAISANTSAGLYTQTVTYTVAPSF